jgi:hypothetical protein
MSTAAFKQTYDKVGAMGKHVKAAGKPGPSNDEQLKVRVHALLPTKNLSPQPTTPQKRAFLLLPQIREKAQTRSTAPKTEGLAS